MRTLLISAAMLAGVTLTATTPAAAQMRHVSPQLMARLDTAAQRYMPAMNKKGNPGFGAIGNGGVDTTELQLSANTRHVVFALCAGCGNLDIQVFAPNGTKLGEDMAPNATPVVEFTTGPLARYRVYVTMAGCSQPTCEFGMQFMRARQ